MSFNFLLVEETKGHKSHLNDQEIPRFSLYTKLKTFTHPSLIQILELPNFVGFILMAEMEMGRIEVCEPRSVQVWRGFVSWVAFILQVFIQILRGTPSFFSYLVGLSSSRYSSLLASSSPASPSFKPLPVVELPLQESSAAVAALVSVDGGLSDNCGGGGDGQEMERLTVSFVYWFYFKFLNFEKNHFFPFWCS